MAKNWTVAEVADAIVQNKTEEMIDFGKRFPLATNVIGIGLALSQKAVSTLLYALPTFVTMGKLEKALKQQVEDGTYGKFTGVSEEDDVEDEKTDDTEEAPEAKEATKPAKQAEKKSEIDGDISLKTGKEIWQMCKDAGYTSAELKGKNKAALIEMFNKKASTEKPVKTEKKTEKPAGKYDGKSAKELYKMCKDADLDIEQKKTVEYYIEALEKADEEAEDIDYSKMSAKELYNICKEKGLKPEQKMPVKYYVELMQDNQETEAEDGWGDGDEEEETKPAKPAKSADDEWEI